MANLNAYPTTKKETNSNIQAVRTWAATEIRKNPNLYRDDLGYFDMTSFVESFFHENWDELETEEEMRYISELIFDWWEESTFKINYRDDLD